MKLKQTAPFTNHRKNRAINPDAFIKSQDLTPSHKDHKVNILILNELFLRVLSAFARKYSFYEIINPDTFVKSQIMTFYLAGKGFPYPAA